MPRQIKQTVRAGLVVAAGMGMMPGAHAAISAYMLEVDVDYAQTSTAEPTTPAAYGAAEQIYNSSTSDLTSATVSGGGLSASLTAPNGFIATQSYTSESLLLAAVPNNATFTFVVSGGTYDGQSATLMSPGTYQFPSIVPYFTSSTFNSLQGVNVADPLSLSWISDTSFGTGAVSVLIADESGPGSFLYSSSSGSLVVPANTLTAGQSYVVLLIDGETVSAGSGLSPSVPGYFSEGDITVATMTTSPVPLPAGLWLLVSGLGSLAAVSRRRRAA